MLAAHRHQVHGLGHLGGTGRFEARQGEQLLHQVRGALHPALDVLARQVGGLGVGRGRQRMGLRTIDFYLSPTRSAKAAKRFLGKALRGLKHWEKPATLNTDKAPSYGAAITELKREGKLDQETAHRQVKYLNNVIEADHGKLKMLIKPVRGFKSIPTAYATIKGFEVMRALRKGQARPWCLQPGIRGEVRLVERAFGIGPSALTEAMDMLNHHFAAAA